MAASTYWIDLTDLSLWTGHHTGIQRVVYNLAKYYAQNPQAKFFVYDEKKKTFSETKFALIQAPRKLTRREGKVILAQDILKAQLKETYFQLPLAWRQYLSPKLKPVARKTFLRVNHMVFLARTRKNRPKQRALKPAIFGNGDRIIILGAGWARPTILHELWRLKQITGFKVYHFVHDLIPVYHPHLFGPGHFELSSNYLFDVGRVSDGIIVNSQSSKRDMQRFTAEMDLPEIPIDVIRLGDELDNVTAPTQPEVLLPSNFILTAGTIEVRKNHILLYTAYKLAKARGIELPALVVVGRPGWHAGDVMYAMLNDPEMSDSIIILKDTSDSELSWLYQNCLFTIYPSAYEGWGLPVAESLVQGKLSLTSNTSSLPEIAGDLIEYFQPFDAAQCLEVMTKYLDRNLLAKVEARIRRDYRPQSWKDTYESMNAIIER